MYIHIYIYIYIYLNAYLHSWPSWPSWPTDYPPTHLIIYPSPTPSTRPCPPQVLKPWAYVSYWCAPGPT